MKTRKRHPTTPPPRPRAGGGADDRERLLWGVHAVLAALANPRRACRRLWATREAEREHGPAIAEALAARAAAGAPAPERRIAERGEIDGLLPAGAVHQGLALEVEPLAPVDLAAALADGPADRRQLVVVLDQVADPHNVGAILRSAAAFGARAVVVTDRHAPPASGTLAKSASGALEVVPLVRVANLARALDELKQADFWCVALAGDGTASLAAAASFARIALILGGEGGGLRRLTRERADLLVRIPTRSPITALNVSTAAAIALYQLLGEAT